MGWVHLHSISWHIMMTKRKEEEWEKVIRRKKNRLISTKDGFIILKM